MTPSRNDSRGARASAPGRRPVIGGRPGTGCRLVAGVLAALLFAAGAPGAAHAGSAGDRSPLGAPQARETPPSARTGGDHRRHPRGPGEPDFHRHRSPGPPPRAAVDPGDGAVGGVPDPAGNRAAVLLERYRGLGRPGAGPGWRRVDRSAAVPRFDPFSLPGGVPLPGRGSLPAPGTEPLPGWIPGAAGPSRPAGGDIGGHWTAPVVGYPVSASYGTPGEWQAGYHTGVDFAVPEGAEVVSVGPGTVVFAGESSSYGQLVTVEMADGHHALYAHLSRLHARPGERVDGGVPVGLSGNTGRSSGPHLHFEVREGADYGTDVDPVAYLRRYGVEIG
ncbi:M23 family metallopeptidase [Streptomyces sp. ST2-7A]|uniref:M23 family metallopeptidase n=1 Tax=Streptomyces sp. ST2-7A TaxID=2907214 RepID=UPI001F2698E0|nr:M23 family metallopeptidase [Streptomyces sp. ST2-7A]MCE7079235.1 peptidoglycan DD-metalloendopeptidase family protein [Streptomyces sp. ST2-7A]